MILFRIINTSTKALSGYNHPDRNGIEIQLLKYGYWSKREEEYMFKAQTVRGFGVLNFLIEEYGYTINIAKSIPTRTTFIID